MPFITEIIIVSNNSGSTSDLQEIWDFSREIKCSSPKQDTFTEFIAWDPLTIEMLEVATVAPDGKNEIDCWMDIVKGVYPSVSNQRQKIQI